MRSGSYSINDDINLLIELAGGIIPCRFHTAIMTLILSWIRDTFLIMDVYYIFFIGDNKCNENYD